MTTEHRIRMQYAGAVQLLCDIYLELPNHSEYRSLIEDAVKDWCKVTGWSYVKILSRIELIPPKNESV